MACDFLDQVGLALQVRPPRWDADANPLGGGLDDLHFQPPENFSGGIGGDRQAQQRQNPRNTQHKFPRLRERLPGDRYAAEPARPPATSVINRHALRLAQSVQHGSTRRSNR